MTPQNENFARDVQALVLSMPVAQMLKLRFERIEPGEVDLCLPYQESLSFRPGQLQATPVFAIADFAAVSAAGTLLPTGWLNATIDCSIKYLAPADGETLLARGRAIQTSKLLTVARADVFSRKAGRELLCATMLATARNLAPAQ